MKKDTTNASEPSVLRRKMREVRKFYRIQTGQMRALPDFIVIGGQKCGSTSLYKYLVEHTNIAPASTKGASYFAHNFAKGQSWYRSHFPTYLAKYVGQLYKGKIMAGESSPYYIYHPMAPQRISQILPNVKLIALLRNPIDRAYSHYNHEVRNGDETLSFKEAIEKEPERLQGEMERIVEDVNYYGYNHRHFSYLSRGRYIDQLEAWTAYFPKEQILVLTSENFFKDTPSVLNQIAEFLNLPPAWELNEFKKYNKHPYSKMDPSMRAYLRDYFRPHNQRLYEFLDMDLGWD